jgi:hypothetical protein
MAPSIGDDGHLLRHRDANNMRGVGVGAIGRNRKEFKKAPTPRGLENALGLRQTHMHLRSGTTSMHETAVLRAKLKKKNTGVSRKTVVLQPKSTEGSSKSETASRITQNARCKRIKEQIIPGA